MAARGTKEQNETRFGGPYREIEPAPARSKEDTNELWTKKRWIADLKADGWRFLMHLGGSCERMYLTGRRVSTETKRLSEKGLCAPMLAPQRPLKKLGYTVLDGEVMAPSGAGFRDIAGIMNVEPQKAAARVKQIGAPRFYLFDVLWFNGMDVRERPLADRLQLALGALTELFSGHTLVQPMPSVQENKLGFYEKIIETGGEGVILKDLKAHYGQGWCKVKREHRLDVVITGFEPGNGKYANQIGAALVSVFRDGELVRVGSVSGMTDDMRFDMTKRPQKYVGKPIEIAAQEFQKDGLRHPRFKRLRPDLDASACTWNKMQQDLLNKKVQYRP